MHEYSFGFVCFSSCMFFFLIYGFFFFGGGGYGEGCSPCLFIINTTGFYTCKLISNVFYQTIVDGKKLACSVVVNLLNSELHFCISTLIKHSCILSCFLSLENFQKNLKTLA